MTSIAIAFTKTELETIIRWSSVYEKEELLDDMDAALMHRLKKILKE